MSASMAEPPKVCASEVKGEARSDGTRTSEGVHMGSVIFRVFLRFCKMRTELDYCSDVSSVKDNGNCTVGPSLAILKGLFFPRRKFLFSFFI